MSASSTKLTMTTAQSGQAFPESQNEANVPENQMDHGTTSQASMPKRMANMMMDAGTQPAATATELVPAYSRHSAYGLGYWSSILVATVGRL